MNTIPLFLEPSSQHTRNAKLPDLTNIKRYPLITLLVSSLLQPSCGVAPST